MRVEAVVGVTGAFAAGVTKTVGVGGATTSPWSVELAAPMLLCMLM